MTYLREGAVSGVDCKKPYLDDTLETIIKQDIRYRQEFKSR